MAVRVVSVQVDISPEPRPHRGARALPPLNGRHGASLSAADVRSIAERALAETTDGHPTKACRDQLQAIDRSCHFSADALLLFQDLLARLGVATHRPILLPLSSQPFWLRAEHPLANHQTTPNLPASADVVVIGAGLTGAAVAYRLRQAGQRVVVLDQGIQAARQAVATAAISNCCPKIR